MSENAREIQTVTGPVPVDRLGVVLPHEHLFNDLSAVVSEPGHPLADLPVSPSDAWRLRRDPYCSRDNLGGKALEDVLREIDVFRAVGGATIVDVTPSAAIGRDPVRLRRAAELSGVTVVMGCGSYFEKFEAGHAGRSVDVQGAAIDDELTHGDPRHHVRPGIIGEIGVSPAFTQGEQVSLRAAALAQLNHPRVPLMIHLPGWRRLGHAVLDVVVDEIGVAADRVVLAHMDPSGTDPAYQVSLADRGVWLEFDMIGMDITFPGEGTAPSAEVTADVVSALIWRGYGTQLLLSHDLFLKQMWTRNGGNGLAFVPAVFTSMLLARGVEAATSASILRRNPARMLSGNTSAPSRGGVTT
ncbi:phosphotriesterase [Amycolatopsis sp. NPDC088138]|uniref:phosphotriesterase family protein n=1 Tax=Amycolatopsis sp. NPDC088138 TaxID=3363938 RepID=UPI00382220C9